MPSWMKVALSDLIDYRVSYDYEFPNFGNVEPEPHPEEEELEYAS